MVYGQFNAKQAETVKKFVSGKIVWDLGAGLFNLSLELAALGAKRVYGVESERIGTAERMASVDDRVVPVWCYFADLPLVKRGVAFVSWPYGDADYALTQVVSMASTVIYLGKNTDGTACGGTRFFSHLAHRRVVAYVPDKHNTLIVYTGHLDEARERLHGEEYLGLTKDDGEYMTFEEAEGLRRVDSTGRRRRLHRTPSRTRFGGPLAHWKGLLATTPPERVRDAAKGLL